MDKKEYKTKSGRTQFMPSLTAEEYSDLTSTSSVGFCVACGEQADGVEPDARKYTCECCGVDKVYGLEELLMMNLIYIVEES